MVEEIKIDKKVNERLQVKLGDWELDNPIIPASGTFGYGVEYAPFYDLDCLASMVLKGTSIEPRFGNGMPRIAECASGMLNSVGLQNPGIDVVINEYIPRLKEYYHKKVIANVIGNTVEEYAEVAKRFDQVEEVAALEINISCPNVKSGMAFGSDPEQAATVTKAVKAVTTKPVYMKLTPNVTDIASIAKACEDAGADGISLINTVLGMRIDLKKHQPILDNVTGGISGPCIFPIALRMVYDVYEAVDIPVIGMGGISSAKDVIEMMMAGATAVEIGAANLVDPLLCPEILQELPQLMDDLKIDKLSDIIGVAHK